MSALDVTALVASGWYFVAVRVEDDGRLLFAHDRHVPEGWRPLTHVERLESARRFLKGDLEQVAADAAEQARWN